MKIAISASLDHELLERLKFYAKSQDRSVNYVINQFIEEGLDEHEENIFDD